MFSLFSFRDTKGVMSFDSRDWKPLPCSIAVHAVSSDTFRLEDRRSKVASVTGSFRANEMSRMERVQRKLKAVTVSIVN